MYITVYELCNAIARTWAVRARSGKRRSEHTLLAVKNLCINDEISVVSACSSFSCFKIVQ